MHCYCYNDDHWSWSTRHPALHTHERHGAKNGIIYRKLNSINWSEVWILWLQFNLCAAMPNVVATKVFSIRMVGMAWPTDQTSSECTKYISNKLLLYISVNLYGLCMDVNSYSNGIVAGSGSSSVGRSEKYVRAVPLYQIYLNWFFFHSFIITRIMHGLSW